MILRDVYTTPMAVDVLWQLLRERDPRENISHQRMPTWEQHCNFVFSRPYACWYIVEVDGHSVGATYVTRHDEIGIGILKEHREHGYAERAIKQLMLSHPRARYLANINPANEASIALFKKAGFEGPIQITLERRA